MSGRATLGRVGGFVVGIAVAGLCGVRALSEVLWGISALTLSAVSDADEVERADLTPCIVEAVVWAVLAVVAVVFAYVVLTPGRPRRATTLAAVGIAVLAVGYALDVYVVNPPTPF